MQALRHIMEGDLEKAQAALENITDDGGEDSALRHIQAGAATLSDLARKERGNREQRRRAAKARR